jgi:hypothetical protein
MIQTQEPRTDIRCYVCDKPAPWDPGLKDYARYAMGAQSVQGWGLFIEKRPHPDELGPCLIDAHLCPAHANWVAVELHYLRRKAGLPVKERK